MEDLARRTQEWKDSHPLKRWRYAQTYTTQGAALALDIKEARILQLEAGDPPTGEEMRAITQRTGITRDHWTAWERAVPGGRVVSPQG